MTGADGAHPDPGPAPMSDAGPSGGSDVGAPARRSGAGSRPPRRRRRWRLAALGVIVGGLAVLAGLWVWIQAEAAPAAHPGPQVVVTVPAGAGWHRVTDQLAAQGVIGSALAYRLWSQLHSLPGVQPGAYALHQGIGFAAVRQVLASGPNVDLLAVPPGFTVAEVATRVGQLRGHTSESFRAVVASGAVRSPFAPSGSRDLEGLLGTGTYVVVPGETDRALLQAMVDRFDATAAAVHLAAGAARLGRTPYEMVIIASIVQKEGVYVKNMGPVARVVLNRLARGMPLQMDSTVLYALGQDGGPVTPADLKIRSPYNTYLHTGLTPTPTCLPSRAALEASLDPPPGSWLFFVVVSPDGTEAFADTFAGQQANEALAASRGLG